ncbi:MAG: hypothetical protein A4S14_15920 [Proteobacteria bacterium SG_bin9]|nr:MAG: hypothetical protein A4S14_15920 [Proteobacteria bacterium SG_bin9]
MKDVLKTGLFLALVSCAMPVAASADEFKLSNNQRIACSRGLSPGKLNTANCRSYAYIFNATTSEYHRCQVSVVLTRDNKEVLNIQADGSCSKRQRVFDKDGQYSFDAVKTEPPNTNSFFGTGGYAIWVSDNKALKAKGCVTIATGLGNNEVTRCVDMTFGDK